MQMRTILRGCAAVLVATGTIFALGPRPDMDVEFEAVDLPEDLDQYIASSEAPYSDITPGATKAIIWADSTVREKTPLALVYLHGFSATRQETYPLTENLADSLDANAFLARLRGHGRGSEPFAEASLNDWLNDVAEAIAIGRELGDRVVLIGTSTGATLAAWAAAHPQLSPDLAALILISPNFRPADPSAAILTWPWGGSIAQLVVGPYREWQPHNEPQGRFWTTRYPTEALLPMAALVKLVSRTDLGAISVPTLVLYSTFDQVVSVDQLVKSASTIGGNGAQMIDVGEVGDPDDHVLAGDILSPDDTDRIATLARDFLRAVR